jgi:hypothetical protein
VAVAVVAVDIVATAVETVADGVNTAVN